MKNTTKAVIAAGLLATSGAASAQNLIQNGGFNDQSSWVISAPGAGSATEFYIIDSFDNTLYGAGQPTGAPYGPDNTGLFNTTYEVDGGVARLTSNSFTLTNGTSYTYATDFYANFNNYVRQGYFDVDLVQGSTTSVFHLGGYTTGATTASYTTIPAGNPTVISSSFASALATGTYQLQFTWTTDPDDVSYTNHAAEDMNIDRVFLGTTPVPEPSGALLGLVGVMGLLVRRRR